MSGDGELRSRYIVVEGIIGVGKTTLVHQLARRLNGRTVLEEFEENPFLADFYLDKRAFAFSTQIFFLMSRFRQQEILAQADLFKQTTVSDYMFDKDRVFALLTLESHELALYQQLFEVLRPQVPQPDLVVFLTAKHEMVMKRIAARGRSYERDMDPEYIRLLAQSYAEFFRDYTSCPVLTIDTTDVDFRYDDEALRELEDAIMNGRPPLRIRAALGRASSANPTLPGF